MAPPPGALEISLMSLTLAEMCSTPRKKRRFRGKPRLPKPCKYCTGTFVVNPRGRLERAHCYAEPCERKREAEKNAKAGERYREKIARAAS